jgi:NAD-dependent deacetylase
MRPDVVWFGESLDPTVLDAAFSAAKAADVCLVVGTSALVYPAASVPDVTRSAGGGVIEVNLEPTGISPTATTSLLGPAGALLPRLLDRRTPGA